MHARSKLHHTHSRAHTRPVPPNPAVEPLAVSFLYRFSSPSPVMNRYFVNRVVIPYSPMLPYELTRLR